MTEIPAHAARRLARREANTAIDAGLLFAPRPAMTAFAAVQSTWNESTPIPRRSVVVGANRASCREAAALAAAGDTVTLIVRRGETLRRAERALLGRMATAGVEVLYGRDVVDVQVTDEESVCVLGDGCAYPADRVLVFDA